MGGRPGSSGMPAWSARSARRDHSRPDSTAGTGSRAPSGASRSPGCWARRLAAATIATRSAGGNRYAGYTDDQIVRAAVLIVLGWLTFAVGVGCGELVPGPDEPKPIDRTLSGGRLCLAALVFLTVSLGWSVYQGTGLGVDPL